MSDRYARDWRHAWLAWAAVTLVLALVLWSVSAVLLLVVTGFVLTSLLTGLVRSGTVEVETQVFLRRTLADGARWTVLGVAVIATCMVQGALGFLVLVAMVLTSPHAVRLFLGLGRGAARQPGPDDIGSVLHALDLQRAREVVDRLDLAGLCWAWTHSAGLLVEVPGARAREAVVALRGLYLDEMERRDPAGFAAWLGSGAEAAASPARFLAARPEGGNHGDLAA